MSDILGRLFAAKRALLAEEEARESFDDLITRAHARQHERRGFRAALAAAPDFGVIAEIKHASPSLGRIVDNFDPAKIARIYARAGAHAISVLTEESEFLGDLRYLDLVRSETSLPIIRKDFLSTPYHIAQAAAYGADAVLLIAASLDDAQLTALAAEAERFELDALVEVHDEQEAERARKVGAKFVGVNHRDLRTFKVDLAVSETLMPAFEPDTFLVAESGIRTHGDIVRLQAAGARAFLIGETLMRSDDPAMLLANLRGVAA